MAPKPDPKAAAKAMEETLTQAKRMPLNVVMLIGGDGLVVEAHKQKSTDMLKKSARSNGGSARGISGVMTLSGRTLTVVCEEPPPPNFELTAKKYFLGLGQSLAFDFQLPAAPEPAKAPPAKPEAEQRPAETAPAAAATKPAAQDRPEPLPEAARVEPEASGTGEDEDDTPIGPDLKSILMAARRKPLSFAWLFGAEGLILRADKRKPVRAMLMLAKEAGGKPRGAWGRMAVDGKLLVLVCDNEPPVRPLLMQIRQQLKGEKLAYRVEIRSPAGTEAIEVEAEEDSGAVAAAAPDLPAPEPMIFTLTSRTGEARA